MLLQEPMIWNPIYNITRDGTVVRFHESNAWEKSQVPCRYLDCILMDSPFHTANRANANENMEADNSNDIGETIIWASITRISHYT